MTDPSCKAAGTTASRVQERLQGYYETLVACHRRAVGRVGGTAVTRSVGGAAVRFWLAGERLPERVWPGLTHLPSAPEGAAVAWEILAWDEAEAGVPWPAAPWPEPAAAAKCKRVLPAGGEDFRIPEAADPAVQQFGALSARQAVWCTPDARTLPTHHCAAPFLLIFQWWIGAAGLRLLHAGCVGTEAGAVLLAGKGGAGKSTTALLCALDGMDYLSDDYCLIRAGPEPEAYCLFGTGKLHREHLASFPALASRAVDPGPDIYRKPVIFLARERLGRVVPSRRVKAVVAPHVVGTGPTRVIRITAAEALRALAPSTLWQLPGAEATAWAEMAALVRALPAYRLELGGDPAQTAGVVRALLESVA